MIGALWRAAAFAFAPDVIVPFLRRARLRFETLCPVLLAALTPARALTAQSVQTPEPRPATFAEFRPASLPAFTPPPAATLEPSRLPNAMGLPKTQATLYRIILTGYRPNYFIIGTSSKAAVKFQLSLKLDLWPNPSQHSLYFGYTQKSIWDLYGEPDGFVDSNYAPELFYGYFKRLSDLMLRSGKIEAFMDEARLGLVHESNGRDDEVLRSWDRVYGFVAATAYLGRDHYVRASLEAWLPLMVSYTNRDITDYLGYGRLGASYGFASGAGNFWGGVQLCASYVHGWTFEAQDAVDLSLEWRPGYGGHVRWWRFTPNFFAQLYSGYGEYLLAYDEFRTSLRIGLSIGDRVYWVNGKP
jgi:outer membrane phospholipase A